MADAEFFQRQAAKCLRLSRTSYDMETSRQLRQMAAEFMEMAEEYENGNGFFGSTHESSGSRGGDMDRG